MPTFKVISCTNPASALVSDREWYVDWYEGPLEIAIRDHDEDMHRYGLPSNTRCAFYAVSENHRPVMPLRVFVRGQWYVITEADEEYSVDDLNGGAFGPFESVDRAVLAILAMP